MSTDPPAQQASSSAVDGESNVAKTSASRSASFSSHKSDDSQTAADFIRDQMQLEADAREALPYSIDNCTKLLGPLRQSVFACMTCTPPPKDPDEPFSPAGVCYACSVQCHGEHTLVEIFTKRHFTCDCGTTRLPATSPCSLRIDPETNSKGGVHSEEPDANNKYNHNFKNRFCSCACDYDPFQQKGTMFQCLGLGTTETGGCGEDWYHPGCLVGMGPEWFEKMKKRENGSDKRPKFETTNAGGALPTISEDAEGTPAVAAGGDGDDEANGDDDPPMPPGFPEEDDFEGFLCYKCVDANPWIKKYAGAKGFLGAVPFHEGGEAKAADANGASSKRKAEEYVDETQSKRIKVDPGFTVSNGDAVKTEEAGEAGKAGGKEDNSSVCTWDALSSAPPGPCSLFFKEDFRDYLCRCSSCYVTKLNPHPQLLEEEETYEPPLSEGAGSENGGSTNGSGSLLDRGESALRNVDRVRAIEGVMAYNHLKDKLKPFFQQFADSGQAIGAEDIKAYFAKLRGDEQGIKEAGEAAGGSDPPSGDGDDSRREQSGY